MTATSFFWHDYETFGRVPRRDRPAQFAGIRTDAQLNEVGPPVMHYCRPSPDSLPDPESCLLTGIVPQTCLAQGLPEHAFAAEIEGALAQPGTIGVGYNTIRFDDEVTRHLFWRNLIDPYAREWQNECGRWDLLDVVRATWALRPEGLSWPTHDDGRPSFKLEHLTRANAIAHEAAHDALSDVRATIALARLIRDRQPRLWEFCLKLRRKEAVWAEVGANRPFLHISGMFGVENGCMAIVWPLAPHPTNKNELLVWGLAHDPQELAGLSAETLRQRLFTRSADLPEGVTRLPVKSIHANKSPIVVGNLKTLSAEAAARHSIDVERALRHAQAAPDIATLMQGAWREVYARPASTAAVDVDEDLYGGFVGNDDRRKLERLRRLSGEQLAGQKVVFDDPRLEEILFRYRARNFGDTLSAQENERWVEHCSARLHEGAGGATTLPDFFERIDQLNEEADERGQEILGALYDYAEQIAPPLREGVTRVAVVGAGAVGCYYGGMLARAGVPVTLVGRASHVEAMRRDGLRLTTASFDEQVRVEASTDVAAVAGANLVLACVKSTDTESMAAQLAAHLAPGAAVLSLQNGVDNAPRMQALLGRPVAPAVVYVATEMDGPGHVRHKGRGELVIPSDIVGALDSAAIAALFARAGVPVELSDNVVGALWGKLLLNCGYNAISAITGIPYGRMVTLPGVAQTVHDTVVECLAVAAALQVVIPGDVWASVERIATSMPGQVSSTCRGLRRGKPTEIDHLNGFIVREGERLGIATPLNRALWALVKAVEVRTVA